MYLATSNPGKVLDLAALVNDQIQLSPLPAFAAPPDVVEDGVTFEENACKKARAYSLRVEGELLLADDSGLAVAALDGAPGVLSARYAAYSSENGEGGRDAANNAKLVAALKDIPNRDAKFICVLALARSGNVIRTFTGECAGTILRAGRGTGGFGYDPLFLPFSFSGEKILNEKTFAELSAKEKAAFSHRGKAFREFMNWYKENPGAILG